MKPRIVFALAAILALAATAGAQSARGILDATGVQGGLVVHLGCGDGRLTADLRANDSFLVHGLDADAANVERTRELLHAKGLYGAASADLLSDGKLPYVEDTVDLLVAADLGAVSMDEVLRVLSPEGVAYVGRGGRWQKTVKPRPDDIDEWTHFLHDAGGDATAKDTRVGPPRRLRWVAPPVWCRSHECPSSVGAVVTAGGRIFTIYDESVVGVYRKVPQKWRLVARDAFNGVLLWKVSTRDWQPEHG
ncbi:MAG: class I SAM-dependent methyltransferase, partial [Planctomycetota bacterium]